jgi:hypothetical protein
MKELMLLLLVWIGNNSTLEVERVFLPEVKFISSAELHEKFNIEERCDGVKIKALYHRDNKIIYLHEDWNEYNLLDRSFLLHELVHHRQKESEYMCRQEMEHEAYELQFKFLKENAINNPQEILDINDVFYVILTTCAAVE